MNKLRWHLTMFKRKLGWLGVLGLAGMIFGMAYFFFSVDPAQKALVDVRHALLAAEAEQKTNMTQQMVEVVDPSTQLDIFMDNFPKGASINATWVSISSLQKKFGLNVDRTVYEASPQKGLGLLRYHLNMPLKATYPQIRNFLAALLQENANLALENISFKRETATDSMVDANVDLVVYVRAQ